MEHGKIENMQQLRAEISRLKSEAELLEQKINYSFQKIQESLKPENIIKHFFSRLTSGNSEGKNVLMKAINFAISLLLQRIVVKTESKVEEKVFELIGSAFERIRHLFTKKKQEKESEDF